MNKILDHDKSIIGILARFEREHPYMAAFIGAVVFTVVILFYAPSEEIIDQDMSFSDTISIINIDEIKTPKRKVKKQVSDKGDPSDPTDVDRASGMSDAKNAVDITMNPSIVPPKPPPGSLRILYPKYAREKSIEAMVYTQLLVAANGKIKKVKINYVKILKELSADVKPIMIRAFTKAAYKTLIGAQFSPPVIKGKNVPVVTLFNLRFQLGQ